jgi:pentose-5-phosphate-3-epimerase
VPKIGEARLLLDGEGQPGRGEVHVDGGVNRETASIAGGAGADVLVVGSALFQRRLDTALEVEAVRQRAQTASADARRDRPAEAGIR